MKIHILFAQRKQTYEGQHAPEVIAAIDESGYNNNPQFLQDMLEDNKNPDIYSSLKIIGINVDMSAIKKILNDNPILEGTIEKDLI